MLLTCISAVMEISLSSVSRVVAYNERGTLHILEIKVKIHVCSTNTIIECPTMKKQVPLFKRLITANKSVKFMYK